MEPDAPGSLSLTGHRWDLPSKPTPDLERAIDSILESRGIEDRAAFLRPSLAALPDPALLKGLEAGIARCVTAILEGEAVVVYGDYDVDGVCSTALMMQALQAFGACVEYYIPDRRGEGYGLNAEAIDELAGRASLMITVDCGSTSVKEVARATGHGIDTIVLDHHQVSDPAPPAAALINPHQPDCTYPFRDLCAAGVAFLFICGLRRALRDAGHFQGADEPDVRPLLDLVALATVADMMPLVGVNRTLVDAGLRVMRGASRPGLSALMQVARIDARRCTSESIAFGLGPRLNARGRMEHAGAGVELLLSAEAERARMLAAQLDQSNKARRRTEAEVVEAAMAKVDAQGLLEHEVLVVEDSSWHAGVVGLAASRLARRFHRPAIVIGEGGKGSGRSVEGFNLYKCIETVSALCSSFGGHHAAAGLTIAGDKVDAFRHGVCAAARASLGAPPYAGTKRADLEVVVGDLTRSTIDRLQCLEPCGRENPQPAFIGRGLRVRRNRTVGGQHLSLEFEAEGRTLRGIFFRQAELAPVLPEVVDAIFALEADEYRGGDAVQLRIEDLRPASSKVD